MPQINISPNKIEVNYPGIEEPVEINVKKNSLLLSETFAKLFELENKMTKEKNEDKLNVLNAQIIALYPEVLAERIESWNLQDEKGNWIPITKDSLSKLDINFLTSIQEEINKLENSKKKQ